MLSKRKTISEEITSWVLKRSKWKLAMSITFASTIVTIFSVLNSNTVQQGNNLQAKISMSPDHPDSRPSIYTFFELIPGGCCAMDEAGHRHLLSSWMQEWFDAGWKPKVLSLVDAQRHPEFERVKQMLSGKGVTQYNHYCFFRWLAMDMVMGGGWFSDYDTFPLNIKVKDGFELPNGGKFTSNEQHVPSLQSASAKEWTRLTRAMIHGIATFEGDEKLTDMNVLKQLIRKRNLDGHFKRMLVFNGFPYTSPNIVDCGRLKNKIAVHLSHAASKIALEEGLLPNVAKGEHAQSRAVQARELRTQWLIQC